MNLFNLLTIFFIFSSTIVYSEESSQFLIQKKDIVQCNFTDSKMDYCSEDHIRLYNTVSKMKPNFAKSNILLQIHKEGGVPSDILHLVFIDLKNKKVYPFQQELGYIVGNQFNFITTQPPIVNFNKSDNKFCFTARLFNEPESRLNVENDCYEFDSSKTNIFKRINSFDIKNELEVNNLISQLPYNSDIHQSCLKNKNQDKCSELKLVKSAKIFELYGTEYNHDFNLASNYNQTIDSISGDSIVLPKNKDGTFLIMAPYQEEDEDGKIIPCINIIIMKGNTVLDNKIVFSGKKPITVDLNNNVTYFDYVHGGKKKVISINKLYK